MSWQGYVTYDDTEIINASRVEAYTADLPWFLPVMKNRVLPEMLEQTYTDPATDLAPWYDPDQAESADFLGVYPLDIVGLDSSSRAAEITEFTTDGGSAGRLRHATKDVVFSAVLPARTDAGLDYGLRWLRRALIGGLCSDQLTTAQGLGLELGYLASVPVISDETISPTELFTTMSRFRRNVVFTGGPTVTGKWELSSCNGFVATVSFTATCGKVWEFGAERPTIQGFMDPDVTDPYVGDITGDFDDTGTEFEEVACNPDSWAPLYDPLCPALVAPPAPPSVPLGCYTPEETWTRRRITLPAQVIPLWDTVAPSITVYAEEEVRNLRLRFYRDPDGDFDPDEEPCSFLGDVVISYIPADGTFVFDGAGQQTYVITSIGRRRRADSLVFRTDGKPFDWPLLSCGYQHILTFDLPEDTGILPVVSLGLVPVAV